MQHLTKNMEIKLLDDILKYILQVQKSEKPYRVGSQKIDSSFLEVNDSLFKSAILKLKNDNYIYFGKNVELKNIDNFHIAGLVEITFDGILFIQNGGYQNHYEKIRMKENELSDLKSQQSRHSNSLVRLNLWLVILTLIIAIGTLVAGIYYTIEILKSFGICT